MIVKDHAPNCPLTGCCFCLHDLPYTKLRADSRDRAPNHCTRQASDPRHCYVLDASPPPPVRLALACMTCPTQLADAEHYFDRSRTYALLCSLSRSPVDFNQLSTIARVYGVPARMGLLALRLQSERVRFPPIVCHGDFARQRASDSSTHQSPPTRTRQEDRDANAHGPSRAGTHGLTTSTRWFVALQQTAHERMPARAPHQQAHHPDLLPLLHACPPPPPAALPEEASPDAAVQESWGAHVGSARLPSSEGPLTCRSSITVQVSSHALPRLSDKHTPKCATVHACKVQGHGPVEKEQWLPTLPRSRSAVLRILHCQNTYRTRTCTVHVPPADRRRDNATESAALRAGKINQRHPSLSPPAEASAHPCASEVNRGGRRSKVVAHGHQYTWPNVSCRPGTALALRGTSASRAVPRTSTTLRGIHRAVLCRRHYEALSY
nr:unnamed protein product [Digitaria exilis]